MADQRGMCRLLNQLDFTGKVGHEVMLHYY